MRVERDQHYDCQSRSRKKLAAVRVNLARARHARWGKKSKKQVTK